MRGRQRPGRVRRNNEDAFYIDAERGIFLVVDGIGGQAAGEKAAEIAVDRVRARLERQTGTTEQRIREAIAMANNEILHAARRQSRVGRHGLRADRGGAGKRIGRGGPRGRFAPVPDPPRRDSQDHPRSFAGGRARGQSANSPKPKPCAIRAATRCFATSARKSTRPTTPISSRCAHPVRSRLRAAAVQRRLERPGAVGRDPRSRGAPCRRSRRRPCGN